MLKNYVIIGNSAAAIGTVTGIRSVDKEGKITIISDEPYHTYSRPLISYWLEGKVSDNNIYYRSKDFYKENKVETLLGVKVKKINQNSVLLDNAKEVVYDKLMAATGSKPFIPPMKGLENVKNKFTFMTWDNAKQIKKQVRENTKVLIIGAGLIGLKAAEALHYMGADITVVDMADRILPSILDVKASRIMQSYIEEKNTRFILNTSVDEFWENSAMLKNGEKVEFDILILAVGVRPNTELISEFGGKVGKGIKTDNKQQSSLPNVYSAGDCTESYDESIGAERVLAVLPNAYMQGEVAGINMAGGDAVYSSAIPMNAVGFYGLHIISAGDCEGGEIILEDGNNYKKLAFKDGLLKGYILMGDVSRAGIYTSLIKEKIPVDSVDFKLLKSKPQMLMFGKNRREEKLGGLYHDN